MHVEGPFCMNEVEDKTRQGLDPRLRDLLEDETGAAPDLVYCDACNQPVARKSDATSINGSHAHRCTNPYGIRFHVGCYSDALGCDLSGRPTSADTWFPGFHWRLATCSGCHAHLGWYFERGEEYFYGLILDRIRQS
jgi:hypothetical protein